MKILVEDLGPEWLAPSDSVRAALAKGQMGSLRLLTSLDGAEPSSDSWDRAHRTTCAEALRVGLSGHVLPTALDSALTALAEPGTLAIITGQQPGFLCSPLYSLIKAMQACRLAEALSQTWGRKVVAMFWNHADDHDIAEVHHSYIQNRNLDLQKIALAGLSSGREPLSRIPINREAQGLGAIEAFLQQNFGMYSHCQEALDLLLPRQGETLPQALTRVLLQLLGPHGLIPVEPDWIRPQLSSALADILERDPRQALLQASSEGSIDAHTAALVFDVGAEGRTAWRWHAKGFVQDGSGQVWKPAELAQRVRENPASWSPGALLRPLVQDCALPCYAYIGGLGELAYHAQIVAARKATQVPETRFVPRVSVTLIDEECSASLQKSGVSLVDVLAAKGELQADEDDSPTPPAIEAIEGIVRDAQAKLREQRAALAEIEPSLDSGLRRAADQMGQGIEKLLAKALRIHQNKGGKQQRHFRRLNNRLMPRGLPQERVLGPIEFYTRYGPAWIEAQYRATPPVCASHLAMTLQPES
ncbi:MAG TPA: bacillithiol biosynthesis BshC [Planctomycetota bacterium]|nr:bacillithiol biosynthesis BshC [Planctomycetota bacterium]HPF12957.1 bacillithiol biosynthesis BshC [Planctomycetota bacterium]HRV79854.1 bacillithiol biosynthesis BshC [Planctomycetota bacterium]